MSRRPPEATLAHLGPEPVPATDREIAEYVRQTCVELQRLAGRPRFRTLRYLLDMARLEAELAEGEMRA